VRQFIAFHDTTTFGDRDEHPDDTQGRAGLWPAIAKFLRENHDWKLLFYYTNNNGLTVLHRVLETNDREATTTGVGHFK
jgi:hypothetical protein